MRALEFHYPHGLAMSRSESLSDDAAISPQFLSKFRFPRKNERKDKNKQNALILLLNAVRFGVFVWSDVKRIWERKWNCLYQIGVSPPGSPQPYNRIWCAVFMVAFGSNPTANINVEREKHAQNENLRLENKQKHSAPQIPTIYFDWLTALSLAYTAISPRTKRFIFIVFFRDWTKCVLLRVHCIVSITHQCSNRSYNRPLSVCRDTIPAARDRETKQKKIEKIFCVEQPNSESNKYLIWDFGWNSRKLRF